MIVTPAYAALFAILFVILSVRTLTVRRQQSVAIGTGGNEKLARAVRVHGNFAEYVPMSLLMIFFLETLSGNSLLVHVFGMCLLAGRLSHAWGVSQNEENLKFRVAGMALTFTTLIGSALAVLGFYLLGQG